MRLIHYLQEQNSKFHGNIFEIEFDIKSNENYRLKREYVLDFINSQNNKSTNKKLGLEYYKVSSSNYLLFTNLSESNVSSYLHKLLSNEDTIEIIPININILSPESKIRSMIEDILS